MDTFANSWINCMKLVIYSTVPDILPFFKAESGNTRFKLGCLLNQGFWTLHKYKMSAAVH